MIIRDITERKKTEDEILEINKQLRQLSDYLQQVREEERAFIAREIHDELGQQLTVMKMDVSWLQRHAGKADDILRQKTEDLIKMLDQTVRTVRRIASELRPSLLDDMGLEAAIEWHLEEFEKRSAIRIRFDNELIEDTIPDAFKTGLFRIVQESLTNVGRYAKAKNATISLQQQNDQLVLIIQDNGVGFDKEKLGGKKTLGILGMKERAAMMGGTYEIISAPGKGTTVTVKVPLRQ
jgi:signal transduction histidine kinase